MAEISKPSNLSLTWASGGDVLNPGDTKYATGWQVEIPPRQWFNYLDNRQDSAIAHINQRGVVAWDNTTEYQEDKSYVQGVTNGTVYRCVQTHTNQNPETDVSNTYWIVAFASAGDFYTKSEADSTFLAKASNGSDIPNTVTFRTNLSVYSKAETYTKTEVDSKTTIASPAQAQALTSNATLLTPLRLAEAFKSANQQLTTTGCQKFPGGLIMQWGNTGPVVGGGNVTVSLPIPFPNSLLIVSITPGAEADGVTPICFGWQVSGTTFIARNRSSSSAVGYYIALGY